MEFVFELLLELFNALFGTFIDKFCCYTAKGYLPKSIVLENSKDAKALMIVMSVADGILLIASISMLVANRGNSVLGWILIAISILYFVFGFILARLRKISYK